MTRQGGASPSVAKEVEKGAGYKWMALLTVSIGTFMATVDSSIVNISLPTLTDVFGVGPSVVLWVTLAYMLTICGLMLTVGNLADMLGRKWVYSVGFMVFTLGMALCALSQSIVQFILFRVIQAVGGAMTIATGQAIVTGAFPTRERGKALGILGSVVGLGLMTGPALGGFLLDAFDWRSIFYLRLPVGVVGLAMAWMVLKEQHTAPSRRQFDFGGALTLFLGLSGLLLALNQGEARGWASPLILGLEIGSVALLGLFLAIESKAHHPVMDLALFRNLSFSASNASLLLCFIATAALTFLMPFYLIQALGYSPSKAGLLLTTVPIMWALLSPLSGWLSDKMGVKLLSVSGLGLVALGLLLLSRLDEAANSEDVVLRLVVLGMGGGIFQSPIYSFIMGSVAHERLGVASAMIATFRTMGMSSGLALAGAIFSSRQLLYTAQLAAQNLNEEFIRTRAVVGGFQDAVLVSVIISSLGILASLVMKKS